MELTRRDALVALAGVGAVAGGAALGDVEPPRADAVAGDTAGLLESLTAAAEVLYPSAVEGHADFVEQYVLGRTADRPAYRDGLATTVADLDATARDWLDAEFAALDPGDRDDLLRRLGVETAAPDPDGPLSERVRYYVVNDLLYAFYASPAGGRLVGIENPIGHPGGLESYRRDATDAS